VAEDVAGAKRMDGYTIEWTMPAVYRTFHATTYSTFAFPMIQRWAHGVAASH
jgi:hypothetical protein